MRQLTHEEQMAEARSFMQSVSSRGRNPSGGRGGARGGALGGGRDTLARRGPPAEMFPAHSGASRGGTGHGRANQGNVATAAPAPLPNATSLRIAEIAAMSAAIQAAKKAGHAAPPPTSPPVAKAGPPSPSMVARSSMAPIDPSGGTSAAREAEDNAQGPASKSMRSDAGGPNAGPGLGVNAACPRPSGVAQIGASMARPGQESIASTDKAQQQNTEGLSPFAIQSTHAKNVEQTSSIGLMQTGGGAPRGQQPDTIISVDAEKGQKVRIDTSKPIIWNWLSGEQPQERQLSEAELAAESDSFDEMATESGDDNLPPPVVEYYQSSNTTAKARTAWHGAPGRMEIDEEACICNKANKVKGLGGSRFAEPDKAPVRSQNQFTGVCPVHDHDD